jgi:hypothetical protein
MVSGTKQTKSNSMHKEQIGKDKKFLIVAKMYGSTLFEDRQQS